MKYYKMKKHKAPVREITGIANSAMTTTARYISKCKL